VKEKPMKYWMQTFTRQVIDLENPTPDSVNIIDIAHALSMTCRFGGHSRSFYSVAEHSLLVEKLGRENQEGGSSTQDPKLAMALLLHDSAEAYIGDIITTLKAMLFPTIHELENRWLAAIQGRFDLETTLTNLDPIVKEADLLALSIEAKKLLEPHSQWNAVFKDPTDDQMRKYLIMGWPPERAEREFLSRFTTINKVLKQASE